MSSSSAESALFQGTGGPWIVHVADKSIAGQDSMWSLVAVGDFCMIQSPKLNPAQEQGVGISRMVAPDLLQLIREADLSLVNLEGPVGRAGSSISKSGPNLCLAEETPLVLRDMGFDCVSLANNHIMDYGVDGMLATISACTQDGLKTVGAGSDDVQALQPWSSVIGTGIRLALFSFCEEEFGVAKSGRPGSAWISHPLALDAVRAAAESHDVVIVVAHGGVEEVPFSPVQRRDQLRRFVDAGAALVIGHHPHVPQGWERYGAGVIFHSLGNFYFEYPGGVRQTKSEWGLLIKASFAEGVLLDVELLPVEHKPGRPEKRLFLAAEGPRKLRYLERLSDILAGDVLPAYWQATALHLWQKRYRDWFQNACGGGDGIRLHGSGLGRALWRRVRSQLRLPVDHSRATGLQEIPMLLNLLRNESHRWTIETALELLSGDVADARTPEIEADLAEMLNWVEE